MLEKEFEYKDIKTCITQQQYKELFRGGVPDSKKREAILQLFDIVPISSEVKYQKLVKMAGDDFIEHSKKAMISSKQIEYDFLNDQGKEQLEIMMAIIFKERHIKHSPLLIQAAIMLLIYLKPFEVYSVLDKLISSSQEAFKSEDQVALIRWHFTFEKSQYFKLLSTFIKSYLNTTVRKKRSILLHMNKIHFDFNNYADVSFKTMVSKFVPLPIAIDIFMMYLVEGVKILFRFSYAILKVHKHHIKKWTDPKELIDSLKQVSRRSNYDYKKAASNPVINQKTGQPDQDNGFDYIPSCPVNSKIVTFEEFSKIWKMLPDYVKIRVPQLLYEAQTNGFNIHNVYRDLSPYKNEYKFTLILIQTKQNQVFGCFVDDVLKKSPSTYLGSSESFVFTLKPEIKCFYDTCQNSRYLLCEEDYLQIGGEGDGPAIWVNDKLDKGQTNTSETFKNELLTLGEKNKDDLFEIHNFELFIL